jgi:hypothetical protein
MIEYQHLTADELLHLAEGREQLTDEARLALEAELSRRNLSPPDIESYRQQRESTEKDDKLKRGVRGYIPEVGLGKKFLGKTNRHRDPSGLFEQYDTTLLVCRSMVSRFPHRRFHGQKRSGAVVGPDRCLGRDCTRSSSPELGTDSSDVGKGGVCPARPSPNISVAAAPP